MKKTKVKQNKKKKKKKLSLTKNKILYHIYLNINYYQIYFSTKKIYSNLYITKILVKKFHYHQRKKKKQKNNIKTLNKTYHHNFNTYYQNTSLTSSSFKRHNFFTF